MCSLRSIGRDRGHMVVELLLERHEERVRHDRQYEWAIRVAMLGFALIVLGAWLLPGLLRASLPVHHSTHATNYLVNRYPTVSFCASREKG